ncbi:hypothetical protein [Streptomyces sp. NPDC057910]|uniref:hypothetical protein n=1 Tax=Streptomyces sp. NPDC057910 TaxID=3346278 RepID=UPI0036DFFEFD
MTNQPATARTAADLPKGTRVTTPEGRMGTVDGYDVGRVNNPDHVNYGREYVGVEMDPIEGAAPGANRTRLFVDELTAENRDSGCSRHHVGDRRGAHSEALPIPRCESGATYGVWDELAGGFTFAVDCATEAANWATEQLNEDPDGEMTIKAVCREHEKQPAATCEECYGDDESDDEG